MKNKKLTRGLYGTLLAFLIFSGCQTKERREQERNNALTRNFAEWLAKKADMDALIEINAGNGHDFSYFCDRDLDEWVNGKQKDSVKYRGALERDADVVLDYVGKCKNPNAVWTQIQNAPKYSYGPGSFLNENGEWEYGDSINNGASREARILVNCAKYTDCLIDLYCLRSEQKVRK